MIGLANLLPYLALAGLALEATPVAAKSHNVARHPRALHGNRSHNMPVQRSGAQSKPRYQIMKRADGSKCRVRPAPAAPSAAPSEAAPAAPQPSAEGGDQPAPQEGAPQDDAPQGDAPQQDAPQEGQDGQAPPQDGQQPPQEGQGEQQPPQEGQGEQQPPQESQPPPTAPINTSGSKVGLAWPDPGIDVRPFLGSRVKWYYTWKETPFPGCESLDFAPMLWGPDRNPYRWGNDSPWLPGEFQNKMDNAWGSSGGVQNVLFFNEPEVGGQANIDAGNPWGATVWLQYYLPARTKYGKRLGSASCTSGQPNADWVNQFKQTCKNAGGSDYDCSPDFYPLHYYDVLLDSGEYEGHHLVGFKDYITNYHQKADPSKPVWVTEYGCHSFNGYSTCDWNRAKEFQEGAAAWMDSQDFIERYSSFGTVEDMQGVAEGNRLMDANGGITELGKYILGA